MNMHILSDHQYQQIAKALEAAHAALEQCQHVELDLSKPKQTVPVPAGELKRSSESQVKTHKSKAKRKGRRGVQVLTEGKVLEIKRQLAAGGKSVASIARDFGVHVTTINCIKWGKTWKNVQLQQPVSVAEDAE